MGVFLLEKQSMYSGACDNLIDLDTGIFLTLTMWLKGSCATLDELSEAPNIYLAFNGNIGRDSIIFE